MAAQNEFELVTMGEAMLRFAPLTETYRDDAPQNFLRSIAGDELNVCVALSRLGGRTCWVSVLPTGPLGDVIFNGGASCGVDMKDVIREENAECGTFYVIPGAKTVHYQRRHSAFALHKPEIFDWPKLLSNHSNPWLHVTGITPLISKQCAESWQNCLRTAFAQNVPVSCDFNHRKQLGTLETLFGLFKEFIDKFYLIIFSAGTLRELSLIHGLKTPTEHTPYTDSEWIACMRRLRMELKLPRISCCFKSRDDAGRQRRWSVLVDDQDVVHSTYETPIFHTPKDDIGGGSAWAAGFIDAVASQRAETTTAALRRADVLAALCQETEGDWSDVVRADFEKVVSAGVGKDLQIPLPNSSVDHASQLLEKAGVIAILRASNPKVAIERGVELSELGCRALEVTMDSAEWVHVLRELKQRVHPDTVLGIGTCMDDTVSMLEEAASAGARFALSPINPKGFVAECQRLGIASAPSAFTSNEIWQAHQQGATYIKVFPASLLGPTSLKTMLGVGTLKKIKIMPSGGIAPGDVDAWWLAGAKTIGLGSNLAGKDISCQENTPEFEAARAAWNKSGRNDAKTLFDKCAQRASTLKFE